MEPKRRLDRFIDTYGSEDFGIVPVDLSESEVEPRSDSVDQLTDKEWDDLSNISAADFVKVAEKIAEEE